MTIDKPPQEQPQERKPPWNNRVLEKRATQLTPVSYTHLTLPTTPYV